MDKNVSRLLNSQINKEFYSSYLYFEFANYYQEAGLDGFYNWYYVQAQEEMPRELGRYILEKVLSYSNYRAMDDMTVLVAGMWKK